VVLIVAGFIALLNVALITAMLGQTRVEPSGGVTEGTVGGIRWIFVRVAAPGHQNGQQERRDPNFANHQFAH
jgi:hypothetical protein